MKIAVIGAGISGLVSAYLLCKDHDITVFEADSRIGGHTHTVDVTSHHGNIAVDTGFIVFNEKTYPNFIKLLKILNVPWQPSNMSFSVHCQKTGLVFSPSTLNSLFAQRKNFFRPTFYRMIWDALRFRRESKALLKKPDDHMPLSAYLAKKSYSRQFIDQFIIPMGSAIWSAGPMGFMAFPVRYLVSFFHHHGFLNIQNQPKWLTIAGGSKQYIAPLTRKFKDRIKLNATVQSISRHKDGVTLAFDGGSHRESFDHVIVATHSDQALKMLSDPTEAEKKILGAIEYQENHTVLHTDAALLPPLRAVWASWNYRIQKEATDRAAVTYYMNRLQNLVVPEQYCVTLNLTHAIDERKRIKEMIYHHPIYNPNSLAARQRLAQINGIQHTWYCGAYWGYGFHEDGVNSALAVCKHFGKGI